MDKHLRDLQRLYASGFISPESYIKDLERFSGLIPSPKENTNYLEIPNRSVKHFWKCRDNECWTETIVVGPDFYQNNGIPMCECGEDMSYIKTVIISLQA